MPQFTMVASYIAVVTVTYNSSAVIEDFLRSVVRQTHHDFLLYVIDNGSSDDTLRKVSRYADPRIRVISNPDNLGIAEANNQGIRAGLAAGCKYVLLMNNDTEFGPELIATLIDGLEEHAADMAAPKILFHHAPQVIWSAGGGLDARKGFSGFHHGYGELDRGQFDVPCRVDHAPACCLLIRKEVFERIGMMDGRYFTYVEDTDFSYRAKLSGLSLIYLPMATVLHKAHSLTGGPLSDFMMRYVTRNRVYFMLKHFGLWRGAYYIPAYQLHLLAELLLLKVRFSRFWLREKAFLEGLRLWSEANNARHHTQ